MLGLEVSIIDTLLFIIFFIYIIIGVIGSFHILNLRFKYHNLFKKLLSQKELTTKYPSGLKWLDSNNHWMFKNYQNQNDLKLKHIGKLLSELLPYLPPPQNLLFTIAYVKWFLRNRNELKKL